jgi:hypothetical protein
MHGIATPPKIVCAGNGPIACSRKAGDKSASSRDTAHRVGAREILREIVSRRPLEEKESLEKKFRLWAT